MSDGITDFARKQERERKAEPTEKPAGEELAGKPAEATLAETIKLGKEELAEWEEMLQQGVVDQGVCLRTGIPVLRRLVEAAENWQQIVNTPAEQNVWRAVIGQQRREIDEKDWQIQTVRAQLDDLGKENAEKDRRIKELEGQIKLRIEERDYFSHREPCRRGNGPSPLPACGEGAGTGAVAKGIADQRDR